MSYIIILSAVVYRNVACRTITDIKHENYIHLSFEFLLHMTEHQNPLRILTLPPKALCQCSKTACLILLLKLSM